MVVFSSFSIGIPVEKRVDTTWNDAFQTTLNAMWSVFWNDQNQGFTFEDPSCPGATYTDASVWDVAVAGKAITNSEIFLE